MIQNLLFDLGGVIMDIKKDNCIEAFKELGFADPGKYLGEFAQKGVFGQLESGLIGPEEFHRFVREQIDTPVTDEQIDAAFNRFLIGIPVERLRHLQLLRQRYGIYMLSNTNVIMWRTKIWDEFTKDGLEMPAYFDGITTSFEAKCLKPSPEIFEYAARTMRIDPAVTLFLDDSEANVNAAIACGYHGAHVPEGHDFYQILQDLNLA